MMAELDFFVGVDLATDPHQACLVDGRGKTIGELTFEHSGLGLHEFIGSLERHPSYSYQFPRCCSTGRTADYLSRAQIISRRFTINYVGVPKFQK